MDFRIFPTLALLLGAVHAQIPAPPPPAQPPTPAPAQDPDKPALTPAQEAQALTAERERLEREIAYARDRAQHAKANLAEKLAPKPKTWKAIDAGVAVAPIQAVPPPTQPRPARVATPDDLAEHPNDTMLLVNGRPIPQRVFDELTAFLGQMPSAGDEAMRAQRALYDLVRIEAIASQFQDDEAAARTQDLVGQLDAGKSVAELAKAVGTVTGADPDGKLELTRNSIHGPYFEQIAFATAPGTRARPFRNDRGIVILQVDRLDKGAQPELDKVVLHAIQVPYTADPEMLQKVQNAVAFGQLDVVARDQKTLEMLPEMFRRQPAIVPAPQPSPGVDQTAVMQALEQMSAEIAALQGKEDADSKARLQALQTRYEQLKTGLRSRMAPVDRDDAAKEKADTPPPGKPKQGSPAPGTPKAPQTPPKNG